MIHKDQPSVSVVIPTYNSAAFLGQAVASVCNQTYSDFELIVVDDGSTDDTQRVLEPYRERIRYLYQPNMGESSARNRGIQESRGRYVAFLDADDLWLPHKLAVQVTFMDRTPEAVLVYSPCLWINVAGERIFHHGSNVVGTGTACPVDVFPKLVMGDMIASPSCVMVRRQYLEHGQAFNPAIRHSEDWDLWLRLSLQGPFMFIPEPLACYRVHHPRRRLAIEAAPDYVQQNVEILDSVFATAASMRSQWANLRNQALGSLFLRSAVYNVELGNVALAAEQLASAFQADPTIEEEVLLERVAQEAFRLVKETEDFSAGINFIEATFACFPPTASRRRSLRRKARSKLWEISAFDAYFNDHPGAVWRSIAMLLRLQPSRLRNRGLMAIAVKSALGTGHWRKSIGQVIKTG